MAEWTFTSESVTEGHPDKVADQISDAVVDAMLALDPDARVACETLVTTQKVILAGEVSSDALLTSEEYDRLVREVVAGIGYTDPFGGFTADGLDLQMLLHSQSPDIGQGVDGGDSRSAWREDFELLGAGDQGLMFGYASKETDNLMPLPLDAAHRLSKGLSQLRKSGTLPYLRPDGKTQVMVRYVDGVPRVIEQVLVSTQHSDDVSQKQIAADLRFHLPTCLEEGIADGANWVINPTGRFVVGGPDGDAGLTGRKIIVDTYGGAARHGGGAFSGKDSTKVDRSAAYACRYVAKQVVAAGLADRCEIQVAYAIGVASPFSIYLNMFGTGKVDRMKLENLVLEMYDLRPAAIIDRFGLDRPIFRATASNGHFGRNGFSWENIDSAAELAAAAARL